MFASWASWLNRTMSRATAAHIVRRLTLCPDAALVDRYADAAPEAIVRDLLAAPARHVDHPEITDDDPWDAATAWWLDLMRRPDAGIHERLVWFWHGHLTSGLGKAPPRMMAEQNLLLRRHAMGNFRDLLHEITVDPAMLWWLDGDGSGPDAPNENYARELMELFSLGRGHYTEQDVHNGARALAGYRVDTEAGDRVFLDDERTLDRPVPFLGRWVRTAGEVVDTVCDHPACAPWIAGRMHEAFHGTPPSDERRAELGALFAAAGLEIRPLVEAVVTDPALVDAPGRPRSGLEWFLAAEVLLGAELDPWNLTLLGQQPLDPPDVAGWPGDERWMSSGTVLTRAEIAMNHAWDSPTLDDHDPVADVLRRANLTDVAGPTRATLDRLARRVEGRRQRSTLLCATVAVSPEFNVT